MRGGAEIIRLGSRTLPLELENSLQKDAWVHHVWFRCKFYRVLYVVNIVIIVNMVDVHADFDAENDVNIRCAIDNVLKVSVIMNLT